MLKFNAYRVFYKEIMPLKSTNFKLLFSFSCFFISILLLLAGCDFKKNNETEATQTDLLNHADSLSYISPTQADSIYNLVKNNSEPESPIHGRSLLGISRLLTNQGDLDSAATLIYLVDDQLKTKPDTLLMLEFLLTKGNYYLSVDNTDSMDAIFSRGHKLAIAAKHQKYERGFAISLSQVLSNKGDYKNASEILLQSLKNARATGNLAHQAVALHNLALISNYSGDYREALEIQDSAIEIKQKLNLQKDVAEGYQNKGIFFKNLKEYDSATVCYQTALNILTDLHDTLGILRVNYNIGLLLKNQERYKEAEEKILEVFNYSKRINLVSGQMFSLTALAGIYEKTNRLSDALSAIDTAIAINQTKDLIAKMPKFLENKHIILSRMGRNQEAYAILLQAISLSDSLLSIEKQKELMSLKAQFQTEKQQAENQLLRQNMQLKQKSINYLWIIILVVVLLFSLVATVSHLKLRNSKRQKKLEEVKAELLLATNQSQQMRLENIQLENSLKQEQLNRLEAENKLYNETIDKLKMKTELSEQTLVHKALSHSALIEILKDFHEKLLPFKLKLTRKKDQEELSGILQSLTRELKKDPVADFELLFSQLHPQFYSKLLQTNPTFTRGELQIAAMIRLNFASKDIANIMNLSLSSIETTRHHIRKKLNLEARDNLTSALMLI